MYRSYENYLNIVIQFQGYNMNRSYGTSQQRAVGSDDIAAILNLK